MSFYEVMFLVLSIYVAAFACIGLAYVAFQFLQPLVEHYLTRWKRYLNRFL